MSSTMRTSYRIHARKARLAIRQKPRLSVGLASVVLASLWKLWRHYRLAKKKHKSEVAQLTDELYSVRKMIQQVSAEQKSMMSTLQIAAQSKQTTDELSSRLSRVEEEAAATASRLPPHNAPNALADPFLYERQPLLAEGPTSGALPDTFSFHPSVAQNGSLAFDAMSSGQSLESYQQPPPSSWDLLDLGPQNQADPPHSVSQAVQPYERMEDEARSLTEAHQSQPSGSDMADLLGLPVPPPTPDLKLAPQVGLKAAPLSGQEILSSPGDLQPEVTQAGAYSEQGTAGQEASNLRLGVSVHLQRRRNLVTKQALRHNVLCAQEQSREVYNTSALEALSRAGEQLRKTETLLSEAEDTDEAVARLQQTVEPGAEKPAALRVAEHRAAKAKSACESAYSRLCLAIDSAARHAAVAPLQDSASQLHLQPIGRSSSAKNLSTSKPEPVHSGESAPSRPSRLGLRNGVVVQSQRAPSSGPPPNHPRHQRSSSNSASPSPLTRSLERRSVGNDGPLAASSIPPQPSVRLEKHKRSHSDNFDGSNSGPRDGIPTAEPLGPKSSTGSLSTKEAEAALEAKNLALINELELRRLALHRN